MLSRARSPNDVQARFRRADAGGAHAWRRRNAETVEDLPRTEAHVRHARRARGPLVGVRRALDNPYFQYWLTAADGAAIQWTPIAKDGFDRPAWQRRSDWSRQSVSIGETYDFRVTFPDTGQFAMEARVGTGTIISRQAIHVVK